MKTNLLLLLSIALLGLLSVGCKKNSGSGAGSATNSPAIASISPISGGAGTIVTISGTHFDPVAAKNTVKFNGVMATVSGATATTLVVSAPATGTTGKVTVTTAGAVSNGVSFTYSVSTGPDVYVAGIDVNGIQGYWKNSGFVKVSDCSDVYSIAGVGSDIYLAGPGTSGTPGYWKNGIRVDLDNQTGYTDAVAVSGTDVYLAGKEGLALKYWKNGTVADLAAPNGGNVNSLFVSGSDVYAAGYQVGGNGYYWNASYWKNGAVVDLTTGIISNAGANSIYISGSDIYVVGYEEEISGGGIVNKAPRCWKNGVSVPLHIPANSLYNNAFAVLVSGTDVYVGGQYNGAAAVWKNGTMIDVAGYAVAEKVSAMIEYNGDLYITGSSSASGLNGYWKNGIFTEMDPGCGRSGPGCAGTSSIGTAGIYVK